ncbi:MAG: hypothetical protein SFW36_07215 [Leptolyngbyaceae cyanobacterium bins.59]|nr:hypothetical protein [Leptolyngbyaceae cyanobacterium bins.59]
MNIYLNGKKLRLMPQQAIGKGGEADVFNIGNGQALKLFKAPNHPDYQNQPQEQQAAQKRLTEHQHKLRQFPKSLPGRVVQPIALATDRSGQDIRGYTMPLIQGAEVLSRYSDRTFRQAIPHQTIVEIFQDLHDTVSKLHFTGVVIGDFNDLNVLVRDRQAYLIDADSFQFGAFFCQVFTARFVDPLRCHPQQVPLVLYQPHQADSDWYAFSVMLMQCLLFVSPYGGVYVPKNPAHKLSHETRPLHRITVFHPEVRYPKPALPYTLLPDPLLHHFHQVFEQDQRGEFPRSLLDSLQWTHCLHCGSDHARSVCPHCAQTPVAAVRETTIVRGTVVATRVFRTEGTILHTMLERNTLRWLVYDRQEFRREDGTLVFSGELLPHMRFRLQGTATLIGHQRQVVRLSAEPGIDRLAVDAYGSQAMFEVNEAGRYWLLNGQLLRDGKWGPEYIGDVLPGQTQFWVGSRFGFGYYRAGDLQGAFVFDAHRSGINDRLSLPLLPGQLIETHCTFSETHAWFFATTQEQGRRMHRCWVFQADGAIVAEAEAEGGAGSWLEQLSGHAAIGDFLLVATDDGIVRVQVDRGQLQIAKTFPDTEPFVDTSCQLFAAPQGLYVVSQREITLLKIK